MQEFENPQAKQTIKNSNIGGSAEQFSDTVTTEQVADNLTAHTFKQRISGQKQALQIGNYAASGKWAILALLAILIAYLAFNYLGRS